MIAKYSKLVHTRILYSKIDNMMCIYICIRTYIFGVYIYRRWYSLMYKNLQYTLGSENALAKMAYHRIGFKTHGTK